MKDEILSVRVDAETAAALRERAEAIGMSTSDLLRRAIAKVAQPAGFRCKHLTILSPALTTVRCSDGCDVEPVHAAA